MVLHGWKEISRYLDCGVRTAQRWEAQCGLPITRPREHLRSPVLATTEALDEWAGGNARGGALSFDARCSLLEHQVAAVQAQIALLAAAVREQAGAGGAVPSRAESEQSAADLPSRNRPTASKSAGFDA